VTFNKVNTYKWFKENVYHVSDVEGYDATNRARAFEVLMQHDKIPLGVFYKETRPTFDELTLKDSAPIATLDIETIDPALAKLQESYA